jgi:hypothetical protein
MAREMPSVGRRRALQAKGVDVLEIGREPAPEDALDRGHPFADSGKEMASVFTTICNSTSSANARRIRNGRLPSFARK